jgi:hypothetical protein
MAQRTTKRMELGSRWLPNCLTPALTQLANHRPANLPGNRNARQR